MIEPDHLPFVDPDGWLLPGAQMFTEGTKVQTCAAIEHPTINRECAAAISNRRGVVECVKEIVYNTLRHSALVRFDEPIPHWDGSGVLIHAFWIPVQFIHEVDGSPFKNYNGPQRPFVGHDGNMYICLDEGDIIQPGDYILDDKDGWVLARNCFGEKAPNPCFTSHRQYRRRVYPPNPERSGPVAGSAAANLLGGTGEA